MPTAFFVKGQPSANPHGRPKGTRNKVLMALDQIGAENATDILRLAVEKAKKGDAKFVDIMLKRLWPERKGRPINVELPKLENAADIVKALSSIVNAVATGELTPDEGSALSGILEMQRKAIETSDLDVRLKAIEQLIDD